MLNPKRMMAVVSAAFLLLTGMPVDICRAESAGADITVPATGEMTYEKYLQMVGTRPETSQEILLQGDSFTSSRGDDLKAVPDYNGETGVVCWEKAGGTAAYTFTVKESGFYILSLKYCPIISKGTDIRFTLEIDGGVPFVGADDYVFPLIWKDKSAIIRDSGGNDIRPAQVEAPRFTERYFINTDANYDEPFQFYFEAGSHTLALTCTEGSVAVASLKLTHPERLQSYEQAAADYDANGYKKISAEAQPIRIQAENTLEKSAVELYPAAYRNDPGVDPADPVKIRLNNIGGSNWSENGQWISWTVNVPETGLYSIMFKALQNTSVGRSSARTLYIDGKIPFAEAKAIEFDYATDWYIKTLGDAQPQLIYLKEGTHEIRLEVTMGQLAPILRSLQDALLELNSIYRRIIMITGTEPDTSRDYNLQSAIPDLLDRLMKTSEALEANIDSFETFFGNSGVEISTIKAMQTQLNEFIARPRDIATRLKSFKDNVSALGSIMFNLRQQPLALDYILLASPQTPAPEASASFWQKLLFGVKSFFLSFVMDYDVVEGQGAETERSVTVWVAATNLVTTGAASSGSLAGLTATATGRDQAEVLKRLIDNTFSPEYGIHARLSLVDTGSSLIQATLAGKGPDIALMIPLDTPINLAMRNALVDISKYPEFEQIRQRFYPQALVPFAYNGGIYALPETQDYQMLFYRKDVLEELGLSVPTTWEEFYTAMAILQKNNMQVGIGEAEGVFETLLYQRGESLYNDQKSQTNLKSAAAIDAFKQWTELYSQYGLDRQIDFYSRFRTGEMPLSLQSVTMYSLLTVSAPELKGLWGMAPLPGTVDGDGKINHAGVSTGLSCIILDKAKDKQAAVTFLDWWTSAQTQAAFGTEMEAVMGPSGRYYTANIEAFEKLPWDNEIASVMSKQWAQTVATPQVPGNYYVVRCLTNAFRQVIDHQKNPREQLFKYDNEINMEIARKRHEFGLD